jgi:phosphotriesterase-related protein
MSERSGKVQTVLGSVDPADLGHTQPHEHLLCNLVPPQYRDIPGEPIALETLGEMRRHWTRNPFNLVLDDEEDAIYEMRRYRAVGGGALVDATSLGIGRDPAGLARISTASDVHVVMGAGYYEAAYHPDEVRDLDEAGLAEHIVRDVSEGVDGSGIRAGIIGEIGLGWPVKPDEARVLRAGARAQRETGASLLIHPGRHPDAPLRAIRDLQEAGGDPERAIACHVDRTLFSLDAMCELAGTGCYLEFDLFGQESSFYPLAPIDMPNDAMRIDYLIGLFEAGYGERLLVSQDICAKLHLTRYGGESYSHILENVLPLMERKGMGKRQIDAVCVENPGRLLTFV